MALDLLIRLCFFTTLIISAPGAWAGHHALEDPCVESLRNIPLLTALNTQQLQSLKLNEFENLHLPQLIEAVKAGNWADPIFSGSVVTQDQLLRIALRAHLQGQITREQYVTLNIRWEALTEYPASTVRPLPPEAIFDAEGEETPILKSRLLNIWPFATRPELRRDFVEALRKLPKSEQVLWSYPSKPDGHKGFISNETFWSDFFGGLSVERRGADNEVKFASFGIITAYFETVFAHSEFHLIPQLGVTNEDEVLRGIAHGGRVVTLSFPGIEGVLNAHGLMDRLKATVHDLTHAFEGAFMPSGYRRLLVRFNNLAAETRARIGRLGIDGVATIKLSTPVMMGQQEPSITQLKVEMDHYVSEGILDLNVFGYALNSASNNLQLLTMSTQYNRSALFFFERDFLRSDRMEFANHGGTFQSVAYYPYRSEQSLLLLILIDMAHSPQIYEDAGLPPQAIVAKLSDPQLRKFFMNQLEQVRNQRTDSLFGPVSRTLNDLSIH